MIVLFKCGRKRGFEFVCYFLCESRRDIAVLVAPERVNCGARGAKQFGEPGWVRGCRHAADYEASGGAALAYCALGAAVGYAAGVLMGKLPAAINIPVTLILSVFLWTWAFRTMRELRERKQVIDEMLARCEEMREASRRR